MRSINFLLTYLLTTTSHWTKQPTWLRTAHCGGWCLSRPMALSTPSGACHKRRRFNVQVVLNFFEVDLSWCWFFQVGLSQIVCNKPYTRDACKINWICGTILVQCWTEWGNGTGVSYAIYGNRREHSCDFLSSVAITTLKCQERLSWVLQVW